VHLVGFIIRNLHVITYILDALCHLPVSPLVY